METNLRKKNIGYIKLQKSTGTIKRKTEDVLYFLSDVKPFYFLLDFRLIAFRMKKNMRQQNNTEKKTRKSINTVAAAQNYSA